MSLFAKKLSTLALPFLLSACVTTGSGNPFAQPSEGKQPEAKKMASVKWGDEDCKNKMTEQSTFGAGANRVLASVTNINGECVGVQLKGVAAPASTTQHSKRGAGKRPSTVDATPTAPIANGNYPSEMHFGKISAPNCEGTSGIFSSVSNTVTNIGVGLAGRAVTSTAGTGVAGNVARTAGTGAITSSRQETARGRVADEQSCRGDTAKISADIKSATADWKADYTKTYGTPTVDVVSAATFDIGKLNLGATVPTRGVQPR